MVLKANNKKEKVDTESVSKLGYLIVGVSLVPRLDLFETITGKSIVNILLLCIEETHNSLTCFFINT